MVNNQDIDQFRRLNLLTCQQKISKIHLDRRRVSEAGYNFLRGCLHDTRATFATRRVHSGSLSWLYICVHDTTRKSHAGASRPGVSSLRLSHRGENFTPVRNLATVSCKYETTTRFGVKSFSSPEPLGSICNLVSLPRDQETSGSGDENGVKSVCR